MTSAITIYATYPDEDTAAEISRGLVEAKLVACANILAPCRSLYEWEGAVQDENETPVIYKSTAKNFEAVKAAILKRHPYDTPCIISHDIIDGHPPFLEWVVGQSVSE